MDFFSERTTYLYKSLDAAEDGRPETPYQIREMNVGREDDLRLWCEVVNQSYTDASYTADTARELLTNHPLMKNNRTFFVADGDTVLATISVGVYRANEAVGGFFRIAVVPEGRKKGLGTLLLTIGEKELIGRQILSVQEAVKLKRAASLRMHFSHGYLPEKSIKDRAEQITPKRKIMRLTGVDALVNARTRKIYRQYLENKKNN